MSEYTTPIQANKLKKGMHMVIKTHPCKIIEIHVSKTGKHGHVKMRIIGIDVFSGKKYEDVTPSTHTVHQPILTKEEYQIIDICDDYLSLIDEDNNTRDDIRLSAEVDLRQGIINSFEDEQVVKITLLSWGDIEEVVISFKIEQE